MLSKKARREWWTIIRREESRGRGLTIPTAATKSLLQSMHEIEAALREIAREAESAFDDQRPIAAAELWSRGVGRLLAYMEKGGDHAE